jgi:hypothetical protein
VTKVITRRAESSKNRIHYIIESASSCLVQVIARARLQGGSVQRFFGWLAKTISLAVRLRTRSVRIRA